MSEDLKDINNENSNDNNIENDNNIADEAIDNKAPDTDDLQQDAGVAGQGNPDGSLDECSSDDSSILDTSCLARDSSLDIHNSESNSVAAEKLDADNGDREAISNSDENAAPDQVDEGQKDKQAEKQSVTQSDMQTAAYDEAQDANGKVTDDGLVQDEASSAIGTDENLAGSAYEYSVESDANSSGETETYSAGDADAKAGAGVDKKALVYRILHILCIAGFIIFGALFINEVVIQPIRIKNSIDKTRELYKPLTSAVPTAKPTYKPANESDTADEPTAPPTPTPDPNRDEYGRLLQFSDLLAINDDVKGWITIPDSNIDYVVVQSDRDNPEYYLDKDIFGEYSKAGTLFLDVRSSVERNTQSLVIYGHNMVSTPEKMFRDLIKYKVEKSGKNKNKVPSFYKNHPVVNFDTIYQTGQWKVFSVFITNGSNKKESFFDFTKANFRDASDFLNFVYQLRIRSELNIDCVDITDTDQLLVLSTCSYEIDDYRTVVVARRVRDGEDPTVDVDSVTVNKSPLYPQSYYYRYGGKAPELPETFEEALASSLINWYTPPELVEEKMKQNKALMEAKKLEEAAAEADVKSKKATDLSAKADKPEKNAADTTEAGNQEEAIPVVTPLPDVTDEADDTNETIEVNESNEAVEPGEASQADETNEGND